MDVMQRIRAYLGLEKQQAPEGYAFPDGPWPSLPVCLTCGAGVPPSGIAQHDRWHAEHETR
ncbi:hypothetical protein [Arsenicicoccus dermatophilus]|uniref:hypothetical protein n=1 Tax=Arsenicicoccus dermatophilus TaxID=1076331 RepID=UPI001F4D1372|nr:hypothetical protein [Arsenicicoccus dermatophilus]MCH8613054.1 hypothetical protein [Arsenicicoccus dermatophilus]